MFPEDAAFFTLVSDGTDKMMLSDFLFAESIEEKKNKLSPIFVTSVRGFGFTWSEILLAVLFLSVSNGFCLSLYDKAVIDRLLLWLFSHLYKETGVIHTDQRIVS